MTIEEMIIELGGIYPFFFKDQIAADARFALYRRALGHLKPEQLDHAYGETMKGWGDKNPPMPKDILQNVRTMNLNPAEGFNFKRMNDALPGLIAEIKSGWWRVNGGWVDRLVEEFQRANPGHDEAVSSEIRMRIKDTVSNRAHTYAQRVYRGSAAVPDFRLNDEDVQRSIGKPGPLDPYVLAVREGREPTRLSLRQMMHPKGRAA